MSSTDAPRRQRRGLQRIEQILDAADAVFASEGYDAATTNRIASEAAISPGSLYQYFENKQAIAEALCRRYIAALVDSEANILDAVPVDLPLGELIDQVVEPMIAFNVAHPGAKALLAGADLSPELAEATKELNDTLCGGVERLIAARAPDLPGADQQLAAEVTVTIYASLVPSILALPPKERPRHVAQLKAAIAGYWSTFDPIGL